MDVACLHLCSGTLLRSKLSHFRNLQIDCFQHFSFFNVHFKFGHSTIELVNQGYPQSSLDIPKFPYLQRFGSCQVGVR